MERQSVTTDKDGGITVRLETMKIVNALPQVDI